MLGVAQQAVAVAVAAQQVAEAAAQEVAQLPLACPARAAQEVPILAALMPPRLSRRRPYLLPPRHYLWHVLSPRSLLSPWTRP